MRLAVELTKVNEKILAFKIKSLSPLLSIGDLILFKDLQSKTYLENAKILAFFVCLLVLRQDVSIM